MEKLFLTLVLFWFSVCSFAEDYSFSVIKSGIGKKSVIFIPGFASSGDVWKEAVAELGTHYTISFKILLFYKCIRNFFNHFHGILHLILYFCTLEIIPLLFLWKGLIYINNIFILKF